MGIGSLVEPLVVVTLLFGGTWINRNRNVGHRRSRPSSITERRSSDDSIASARSDDALLDAAESGTVSPSLIPTHSQEPRWRKRELKIFGFKKTVVTPNTRMHKDTLLSRLLFRFPFLVEAWYWALIYWVYQLGRAFTALTLVDSTVDVARHHALQVIHLEKRLHLFVELPIQRWFLARPLLMLWTNRIYSFIHIPGTILFLVCLFYYTTTMNRLRPSPPQSTSSPAGPALYQARRRTMATCNLFAFIIFTVWPCMPPRLLSDPLPTGPDAVEARTYGFIDTVHGKDGQASFWTQNRFCNQYAAMPSLHFGYSLLIGLTVMTIPLRSDAAGAYQKWNLVLGAARIEVRRPRLQRAACVLLGAAYPALIFVAIVSTANHFILDAGAGAVVCAVAWAGNGVLLNLLPLEDWVLRGVRIHKPEMGGAEGDREVAGTGVGVGEGRWEEGEEEGWKRGRALE